MKVLVALMLTTHVKTLPPPNGIPPTIVCGAYHLFSNYCTNSESYDKAEFIDKMNACPFEYRAVYTTEGESTTLTFPVIDGKEFKLSNIWDIDYVILPADPTPDNTNYFNMIFSFRPGRGTGLPILLRGSGQRTYANQPIYENSCFYFEYLGNAGVRP
ncbi:hypothetical protein GNI_130530 [Gregarina niphandrodes]|uniref:Transmembrane protein n=1 Tax=Gregarina niphandrodes TaxID=110365 RepID=A0A023B1J3_GRENI|nr:hypothetical protein GNI_130530 [Gregarina niphandrodes]EZG47694.1 hypothetical protein GNI_130530 [Gregarina niphandrodes]|eukprot:XP_011132147.1 hypothetical protein GNI_130530 [Gregarina niphandrodes]